jgi:glycosyltransferase involved in cell wall biosynthesis
LAAAIGELLADSAAREELGAAAARAAAGPYSWDTVAERTLALYRELLDR